jgi:dihydrofolate reductase
MGRIIVSQNVSLDGVVEDPTGEEGFERGGWFNQLTDTDREAWAKVELDEALRAEALLMGRRSEEYFGTRWLDRTGPWAERLNNLPKYVVSSTLVAPHWTNVTVLRGDAVAELANLKQQVRGEIMLYASRGLVHTAMEHDLVDELRLMVYPVVLGAGERVFGTTSAAKAVRLLETTTVGDGLAHLRYEVLR